MEITQSGEPWNKGKLIGQKPPLKLKDIWAIRIHLQLGKRIRDLAMFNLAIDSKLLGCDLVNLRVRDVTHGNQMLARAIVIQRKTQRPVQFELTEDTRNAVAAWIAKANLKSEQHLFPSRLQNFCMFQHGNTLGLFINGSPILVLILPPMAPIRCAEPRLP